MAYLTYKDDSGNLYLKPVNYQKEERLIPSGKRVLATIENDPQNFIMGEARGFGDKSFSAEKVEELVKKYSNSLSDYLENYGLGQFNLNLMGRSGEAIDMEKVNEIRQITKSRPYIGDIYILNTDKRIYQINRDGEILGRKLNDFREHDSMRLRYPGGSVVIPNIFEKKPEYKDISYLAPKLVEGKVPLEEREFMTLCEGIRDTFKPYFFKPVLELKDGSKLKVNTSY